MKVTLGYRELRPDGLIESAAYGTIEQTPNGLRMEGDQETLHHILERARRELPGQLRVRWARRAGPFSDAEVLRSLLRQFNGMTSWFEIRDAPSTEAFRALTAAYLAWDRAWSQTIHTTGLRGLHLLYGLPGDAEYLHWYEVHYGPQMTPEQRSAFAQYVAAVHAWVSASSS